MEDSKDITVCQPAGIEVQILLPIASSYQSHQGKCNAVKHWFSNALPTQRRDRARSISVVDVSCPGLWGSLSAASTEQSSHVHPSYSDGKVTTASQWREV